MKLLSRVWLFATPWTIAYQDPQSMGFSRQEYWSGLPFPSPGDLPDPSLPHCKQTLYHLSHQGSPSLDRQCLWLWYLLWPKSYLRFFFKVKFAQSCPTLQPCGQYSSWNSPGQNTGVGSLSLLQGIFPTQGSNPGLQHCRQILYQLTHRGRPKFYIIKLF